jgi:carbamoyl-phosphate synthase large subunit
MNVLITSASRKVALVRTFRAALAREGSGRVIAADVSPLSAALYEADEGVLVPRSEDPSFVPAAIDLCKRHDVRLLVPTRDEELPVFAEARERFADEGVLVMVAAPETIRRCQDKSAFLEFCESHGFATPRRLDRAAAAGALPVFARPRVGKGGSGAMKVSSLSALEGLEGDVILQELVAQQEYTIDLFADVSGRVISVVPRERVRIVAGESFVSRTARIPALIDAASQLAAALGLVGHNTIQCFFDGTTPLFIEVNPRYGGAAQLGFEAGADTPWFLVRLAMGRPVDSCVGEFEDGLVMLRYTQDLFRTEAELLA